MGSSMSGQFWRFATRMLCTVVNTVVTQRMELATILSVFGSVFKVGHYVCWFCFVLRARYYQNDFGWS